MERKCSTIVKYEGTTNLTLQQKIDGQLADSDTLTTKSENYCCYMMKILTSVFVFLWHDRRMNPWPWPSALQQTRFKCQIQFYNTVTQDRLCLKSILGQWQTIPLQFHLSTWEVSCSVDVKSKPGTCLSTLCKPTVMQEVIMAQTFPIFNHVLANMLMNLYAPSLKTKIFIQSCMF